jgi:hypothetical protein
MLPAAACAAVDAAPRLVDPASHARTAACALALPDPYESRVECTRVGDYTKPKGMLSAKRRKKLLDLARKRLPRFCKMRVPKGVVRGDEPFAFLALDPASASTTTTAGTVMYSLTYTMHACRQRYGFDEFRSISVGFRSDLHLF